MAQIVQKLLWQLSSLTSPIPAVDNTTPDHLEHLFAVSNKVIADLKAVIKRTYGLSRKAVLQRELEYRAVGITSSYFGERNPGASKDFAPVCERWKGIDKSTMSKMLKVMKAEYEAASRMFDVLAGAYTLVAPAPVELPPVGADENAAEVEVDWKAVALQQAENLRVALTHIDDAATFEAVFGITSDELSRGMSIVRGAREALPEAATSEVLAVAANAA